MFHIPQYVPRSSVANQDVRILAQHGPPTPCRMPFMAHRVQNHARLEPNPKQTLMRPVQINPNPKSLEADIMLPSTPDTNLDIPYAMGNMDVMAPMLLTSRPRSLLATMTGAVYVNEFLVR